MSASVADAVHALQAGGVICHACEGVWGLACDASVEASVQRILEIKQRPRSKGLIVIAANTQCFTPELNRLSHEMQSRIVASWPGHTTWLLPNVQFGKFITGDFDTVATRVPAHEQALEICKQFGKPIVSTSANTSGGSPCVTEQHARQCFEGVVDCMVAGEIGTAPGPSSIFDSRTGKQVR